MAYPIEDNDVAQVVLMGKLFGQTILNTFHYSATGTTANEGAQHITQLATEAITELHSQIAAVSSNEIDYQFMSAQLVAPVRYRAIFQPITDGSGQVVSPSLPATTAAIFRRTTFRAGRDQQGRIYLAGVPQSYMENGQPTDDALQAYEIAMGVMNNVLTTNVGGTNIIWEPVLWKKDQIGPRRLVTTVGVNPQFRIQRRREVGLGI